MATNEQEGPPPLTGQQRVLAAVGMTVEKVTDTGVSSPSGISLRVWVMIVVLAGLVSLLAFPLNVVGVVVATALALTLASRTRRFQ